ncbi:MAG: hypothetical protein U9M95_02600 [Candidatus Altiarchaeota archaeon]|nr:hypothetical protein [Candidatus Altiarchaeota archaeon]
MNPRNKAQAMMEYMILMSLALLLLSIVLYTLVSQMSSASTEMNVDSAQKTINRLKDKSNFIYVLGHPSRTETRINIPSNVEEFYASNDLILMRVSIGSFAGDAHTDVYGVARGNLTSDFNSICAPDCSPGNYIMVIEHTAPPNSAINLTVK